MFPITFKISHIHNKNNLKNKIIFVYLTLLFILSLINIYPQNDPGVNWYYATGDSHFPVRSHHTSVVYDNKMWVIGGEQYAYDAVYLNDVWSSSDGANWKLVTKSAAFGKRSEHTSVVYDNKIWVIGGHAEINDNYICYNDVWYSTDGVEWTQATASAAFGKRYSHTSLIYDNKMWVIGGAYYNDVWYSTDGVVWTQATASAAFEACYGYKSIVYDDKMWVIRYYAGTSSYLNDVWYSTDGVIWTQVTASADFSARGDHTSVVYNNKIWVIGGYSGTYLNDAWYSIDGAEWTQAATIGSFPARSNHTSVIYDNKIWVIGGYSGNYMNDVWYSTDGVIWTQATASAAFPSRSGHTSIVYDNKMWVIGGYAYSDGSIYMNDVWYSSDGVTWTQATASAEFPVRADHTSVVYDNKMWVIGGESGSTSQKHDIWYSSDGIIWTQAIASEHFSVREGHTNLVYNNKMWVIGGSYSYQDVWNHIPYIATVYHDDIWYSADGVTWTEAIDPAAFGKRYGHTSLVYYDKMWVISGYSNSGSHYDYTNDVWYSSNGVEWTQATASAAFPSRLSHTSVVYNNKMWIIGGYKYPDGHMNDVWYSLPSTNVDGLIFSLYE